MNDKMDPTREDQIALMIDAPRDTLDPEVIRAWAATYGTPNLERMLLMLKSMLETAREQITANITAGVAQAYSQGITPPPPNAPIELIVAVLPNRDDVMGMIGAAAWLDTTAEVIRTVVQTRLADLFAE